MAGLEHSPPDPSSVRTTRFPAGPKDEVGSGPLIPMTPGVLDDAVDADTWAGLSAIVEQMPTGVLIAEAPTGRLLAYNRRAARLWDGRMPDADAIEDYADRFPAVRIDGSHYGAEDFPLARAIRYGETVVDEEIEFRMGGGETRALLVSASPVRDRSGEIRYAVATMADVTERRVDERRREFFSRLATSFRETHEPGEIIRIAATALGEQLGVSSVALCELGGSTPGLQLHAEYRNGIICMTETPAWLELGDQLTTELRDGRIVAVEDVARHALMDDEAVEAFTAFEARSALAVPIAQESGRSRVVLATHVAPRRWSREDVRLVTRLAERTWSAYDEATRDSSLRKNEQWLRLALRAGAAAAWEWDLGTDRLTWSEEHHEVLGTSPNTRIDTTEAFLTCVHEDDRDRASRAIGRIARMELPREVGMECRIVRRTGGTRWIRVQGRVLLDEAGRPSHAYGVVLDVTDRKEAELEREALLRQLRQANEAKSNFISVMSHEFRTPLTSVIGYAELLESGATGEVSERQHQQLGRIKASAWHLTQVIDEVLTFSRMEAGREEVRLYAVDIVALVRDAITIIEPAARAKSLPLHVSLPDALVCVTDEPKLRQALVNLLGNAVKFTDTGCVRIDVRATESTVVFEVTDTGIGIAAEHVDRIFERFWQVSQGSARAHGGTGLGLTVTRRIAELLGGRVDVRSEPGVGSTFRIELPREPDA